MVKFFVEKNNLSENLGKSGNPERRTKSGQISKNQGGQSKSGQFQTLLRIFG